MPIWRTLDLTWLSLSLLSLLSVMPLAYFIILKVQSFFLKKYFHAKDWFLEINWRYRHFVFIGARLLQETEMKVCFSRSRSSFSSTFFLHTHTQSFKTLISFPTLIQKNTPGGTNFERKNHPPFLHYWLTFRIESDKLVGFSIFWLFSFWFFLCPNPKFRINSNCEKCWFSFRIV